MKTNYNIFYFFIVLFALNNANAQINSVWTSVGTNLNWDVATGFNPTWTDGNVATFQNTGTVVILTNKDYTLSGLNFVNAATYSISGAGNLIFTTPTLINIPGASATMNIYSPMNAFYPLTFTGGTATSSVVNLSGSPKTIAGIVVNGTMRINVNASGASGNGDIVALPSSTNLLRFSNLSAGATAVVTINNNFILNNAATSLGATSGSALVYNGSISGSSTIWFSNDPAGTGGGGNGTTLNNKNSYTGPTNLGGTGTVKLGTDNALSPFSPVVFLNTGAVDLNGYSQTMSVVSSAGTGNGFINNGSNPSLIFINGNQNSTFTRNITDNTSTIGLVKSGSGNLTLVNTQSFSGGVTVAGGGLLVNSNVSNLTNTFKVNNGLLGGIGTIAGTVNLNPSATLDAGNGIGNIGVISIGNLILNSNTFFNFDIADANSTIGLTQDMVVINNNLNLQSLSSTGSKFILNS